MTKFYGLKPVDIELMSYREVMVYRRQMAEFLQEERGA